jgi:hypothetical protein
LLRRGKPLLLHGDGQHTRRYLYAGDAAEAFDTILHKGEIGQAYNVDSQDEISNIQLAEKLLGLFGKTDVKAWIQHTHDRKFNDRRYAVDGSKLHALGWKQRTRFEDALQATVNWYGKFSGWFGDIEGVLTAHPVVKGDHVAEQIEVLVKPKDDRDVKAGAFEHFSMDLDGGGVAVGQNNISPETKTNATGVKSNGHAQNGGKKRKAEKISSE